VSDDPLRVDKHFAVRRDQPCTPTISRRLGLSTREQGSRVNKAELIAKWEPRMNVSVARFHVQRMKTRWGSCNPIAHSIRLNTDLAKKPRECLEYIVVHEMLHLLEPTHNAKFVALMDRFMPRWQLHRQLLNRLPVRHEDWGY